MTSVAEVVIAPLPEQNEVDGVDKNARDRVARTVLESHRSGLEARRGHDLLAEKLLLHIDGSGDSQWADIYQGSRVEIPRFVSEFRKTENLLRLVVDNAVAHHTTMPLRYFAESLPDRESRERALIDALAMNHVAHDQDLNGLFADAMYMAMAAGFCPVHGYWRDDAPTQYEPVSHAEQGDPIERLIRAIADPRPGRIECFLGNPFDTVFSRTSKRGSAYRCTYGRFLPAEQVRHAFGHIPGAEGLQGTTKIPSVSVFQRIARSWQLDGLGIHGSPVISSGRDSSSGEELLLVVCDEALPGVEQPGDAGHLRIVAVPEVADLRRGEGRSGFLLADQPLPASHFSWALFYSHHRGDDILGKPWVEDIDVDQIDLNILLSKHWEFTNKLIESPIVAPGGVMDEDMLDLGGYNILEIEPSMAGWRPKAMDWSAQVLPALERAIEDKRQAIYTGGGYQASSRGEAPGSRMAYRAIVALQQADNSIHGPVNIRFRRSACEFALRMWKQMKAYGDIPWLAEVVGDEYAHLAEPWIDNTKLSDSPPKYKLVNAFGPSPELRAQEVLELCRTRGADGMPFLSTEEARRQYPNQMLFDDIGHPRSVARRRAKTVAAKIHDLTREFRAITGFQETNIAHPGVQRAALIVFGQIESLYPRLQDDDLQAHISTLSEITQDEQADSIARLTAMRRQSLYYEWQAKMAQIVVPRTDRQPGAQSPQPSLERSVAVDMRSGGARPAPEGSIRG